MHFEGWRQWYLWIFWKYFEERPMVSVVAVHATERMWVNYWERQRVKRAGLVRRIQFGDMVRLKCWVNLDKLSVFQKIRQGLSIALCDSLACKWDIKFAEWMSEHGKKDRPFWSTASVHLNLLVREAREN